MALINISKLVTIDRFFAEQEALYPEATGEFTNLLHDLILSIRILALEVRRAGINDILGLSGLKNSTGDSVRRLDEYANEVICRAMSPCGKLCVMVSEEADSIIPIPKRYTKGKYVLIFDPLDGSTNIDVGITIGTTFSLFKRLDTSHTDDGTVEDVLQPGYKQVAAGYVLYGSSTIFVLTTGTGVNVFTYDPTIGEFILTFEKLTIPKRGSQYSCNESYYFQWSPELRQYLDYLKKSYLKKKQPYVLRYVATAVADIHRLLHYGGIYMYPPTENNPNGKIRLLYEANPLAFIIEQAGGRATDGKQRLMDIVPKSIHQCTPFFVGSVEDVIEAETFMRREHEYQKELNKK
jgi:fructose-1,6-bisphosphatase I